MIIDSHCGDSLPFEFQIIIKPTYKYGIITSVASDRSAIFLINLFVDDN